MKINENAVMNNIFFDDGSLRDIYITETSLEDWKIIWELMKSFNLTISIDGDPNEKIPKDVTDIFQVRKEKAVHSRFSYKGVDIVCYFFSINEVEFDVSPREVYTMMEANSVFEFMEILSRLISKDVSLSIENDKQNPLITILR